MGFLIIGVAVGALIVLLLQTLRRYEAESIAAVRERSEDLADRMHGLEDRVRALEAIAAGEARIHTDSEPSETHEQPEQARRMRI
jgi:hypothetical protein